ncbi:3-oxoacyl-ACP reductase [Arthrobacter sp. H5]|uniref:3-oxoacyl-ACP reductase n=1 Tax=Arthrobacter sp. H5 TaxID=1267973 RepID=UPI00047F7681|nr:3-oxoacyl-ACP reductase [Arthrobacter sp. H5]
MSDSYLQLVNSVPAGRVAKALGLPLPVPLRRYQSGAPLIPGPVLVLGNGAGADTVAEVLLGWNQDVRRHAQPKERIGAVIAVLDSVTHPDALSAVMLELGQSIRQLARGARVVSVSRTVAGTVDPAEAAARRAVDGAVRSIARELRGGATANGIVLGDGVGIDTTSAVGALRFLLSGRSAFVNGQFISVTSDRGELPAVVAKPLAGKIAVVTGAARGIGAEIASVLRRDGAQIVVVDVPAAGEQLMKVANQTGATALQLDITRPEAAQRIIDHVRDRHGQLDILVHNAGITRDKLLANMDEAKWNQVIAVNLAAQLAINAELLESTVFSDIGKIVCLASTSGIAGNRGQSNYAASKAGVIGMVECTARVLDGGNRTINAVAPGFIETEMTARIPFGTREVARRLSSLQQGGLPVDVAETIAFLATDAAGGINGQVLRVCGQSLVGA